MSGTDNIMRAISMESDYAVQTLALGELKALTESPIRRFTMFRRGDLSATHNSLQANAPDEPQFEGVVFSDGTTVLRWLTAMRSTSVWPNLATALAVHGHPEARYCSEIVWYDEKPE